jgi:hypothetical protein
MKGMMAMLNKIPEIVFGLTLFALAGPLGAQTAGPPVGNWSGHPDGVNNYPVYLSVQGGGACTYSEPTKRVFLSGWCEWGQTTSKGGILTLHYKNVTVTQTFHNKLYIGITWLNHNSVRATFGNGPHETGIMNRL